MLATAPAFRVKYEVGVLFNENMKMNFAAYEHYDLMIALIRNIALIR